MNALILHPRKQSLFAVLSLTDLTLTWWLLGHTDGVVCEANPVACWWLARFGWHGLAGFKFGMMLFVGAVAAAISLARPRAGGGILGFGCAALGLVVFYSACLCCSVPSLCAGDSASAINRQAEEGNSNRAAFWTLRAQLAEDLIAGRCRLEDAATQLAGCEKLQDDELRRNQAGFYPGRPLLERLAASLINQAVLSRLSNPRTARQIARRLEDEFRRTYGSPPPAYPMLISLPGTGSSVTEDTDGTEDDRIVGLVSAVCVV